MPRMKKPVDEKLADSINTPVTRDLKRRVVAIARSKKLAPTRVARDYIETGVVMDEKATAVK